MAKAGTQKQWSLDQENQVAYEIGGIRTKNSGATEGQKGDVVSVDWLGECKFAGSPIAPAKSIGLKLADWEKISDEAAQSLLTPFMHVRFIADSVYARNGKVDLYVVSAATMRGLLEDREDLKNIYAQEQEMASGGGALNSSGSPKWGREGWDANGS